MCFWASLADFLVAVAPVGTALAALAAAVAAWKALSAWRDEMLGKRKAELAEDALTKFYQAERAISIIRSPIVGTSESEGREREPDETEKESKILDTYYVPLGRIQSQNELFSDLYARKTDGAWRAGYHGQSYLRCLTACVVLVSSSLLPGLR